MILLFHKTFSKSYGVLRKGEKERVDERLGVFTKNPFDPTLNNHPLKGKYSGHWSINIGGDLRAVYKMISPGRALFVVVGTHADLYKK